MLSSFFLFFFFFNDTATTEIYTLSLHDALPIWPLLWKWDGQERSPHQVHGERTPRTFCAPCALEPQDGPPPDRKSTRLNSSHLVISYAVFCLKKKKKKQCDLA